MIENSTAQIESAESHAPDNEAPIPFDELQKLGTRARKRREALRLTRNSLAEQIGVTPSTMFNFELSLRREVQPFEAVWERCLHVPPGWLRSPTMDAAPVGDYPADPASNDSVADEIRKIAYWYSRRTCIDRTTNPDELGEEERDMAEAVIAHYGVHGEEAAHLPSVTRTEKAASQKSRQLIARFTKRIDTPSFGPALCRLQAALPVLIPGTLARVNEALAPMLGEQLTLEGANRFALEIYGTNLCRITPRNELNASTREPMVSLLDGPPTNLINTVRTAVLDMVRFVGAAHIHFIAAVAGEEIGTPLTSTVVLECCRMQSGFEWLSEGDGWFWFGPDTANRIAKVAMKIFAVATVPILAEEVQAAIGRSAINRYEGYRTQPFMIEPPAYVIAEIVSRLPNVNFVLYRDMAYDRDLAREDYLTDTEQMIQDALLAHGGIACRKTLMQELVDSGRVVMTTMERALDMSPIFKHIEPRIWGLRGNRIAPRALENAIAIESQPATRASATPRKNLSSVAPAGHIKSAK